MAASSTSQVYIQVIEDVMNKVRDEFVNNGGPGEEVLKELQAVIYLNFSSPLPKIISFPRYSLYIDWLIVFCQ